MGKIDTRLAELGIELPEVVPPVAAYVPAVIQDNLVFTAGQLPMVSGALPATGKVGDGMVSSPLQTHETMHVSAHSMRSQRSRVSLETLIG